LFCELAVRLQCVRTGDEARFDLPLTQEQIGDVLGLTTVHVNRTLRELRSLDLIEKLGTTVEIPSIARLAQVAEFDESYLHRSDPVEPIFRNGQPSAGLRPSAGEPFS
jgi:transcriptional regulator with XRE-family HTH domain